MVVTYKLTTTEFFMSQEKVLSTSVHKVTAMALLVTIGIVFGDIGTSPLYVMKAITGVNPEYNADYIIGAVSCIIWTLTLQTTLKYVVIALHADNKGEGGILALYSLVKRLPGKWLYIPAVIGASTLIADGVITPAVTVTSAIEGVRALDASAPVVPVVVIIITAVFFVQQLGTKAIGRWFGPFMLMWFLMLGVMGSLHLGASPVIFKAFNPYYAVKVLIDYPFWFLILGAVFLCTTGAEALYSDLGHCGRLNITYTWIFVKIMLILNYLGQGAWLIAEGSVAPGINPFYAIMPSGFLVVGIIMSTGAAIIASQALLSGSFTIFSEAMGLDFWPRLKVKYPSALKGQLYIPLVNSFLYVGCIVTVLLFRTSSAMEAAYGLAITITMLMTTLLLGFYLRHKGTPQWLVILFMVLFIAIEGVFLVSNMFKFMHGGWYTLLLAGIICAVMLFWRRARNIRNSYIEYKPFKNSLDIIHDISRDSEIPKYSSNVVYISKSESPDMVESKLLYSIINKHPKRADHYWVIRVHYDDAPDTLEYKCSVLIPHTLISIDITLGFRIQPQVSVYLRQIVEDLVAAGDIELTSRYPSLHNHGIAGDFRFIIIHRVFSASSNCPASVRFIMGIYGILRHVGISDEKALGLDTSSVTIENVPLIINTNHARRIKRIS